MLHAVFDFISSVGFAIAATFGFNMRIEQPHYDVIERIGDEVEIRQYPNRIAAETTVEAVSSARRTTRASRARPEARRVMVREVPLLLELGPFSQENMPHRPLVVASRSGPRQPRQHQMS